MPPPEDIWQYLEIFGVVRTGVGATGLYWEEARDAAKYPRMHRTIPTAKKRTWSNTSTRNPALERNPYNYASKSCFWPLC